MKIACRRNLIIHPKICILKKKRFEILFQFSTRNLWRKKIVEFFLNQNMGFLFNDTRIYKVYNSQYKSYFWEFAVKIRISKDQHLHIWNIIMDWIGNGIHHWMNEKKKNCQWNINLTKRFSWNKVEPIISIYDRLSMVKNFAIFLWPHIMFGGFVLT